MTFEQALLPDRAESLQSYDRAPTRRLPLWRRRSQAATGELPIKRLCRIVGTGNNHYAKGAYAVGPAGDLESVDHRRLTGLELMRVSVAPGHVGGTIAEGLGVGRALLGGNAAAVVDVLAA